VSKKADNGETYQNVYINKVFPQGSEGGNSIDPGEPRLLGGAMPRIRTLKPDLWADDKFGYLSYPLRLLWIGLLTQADDEGRLYYRPRIIRVAIFPYDDDLTDDRMEQMLEKLSDLQMILIYRNGRRREHRYIQIVNWSGTRSPATLHQVSSRVLQRTLENSVGNGKRKRKRKGEGKNPARSPEAG